MVTNVSITQRVNLTGINGSLDNLTTALINLNNTVQSLDIPPDTQNDVNRLQQENNQLRSELTALQKKVGTINGSVVVNNNTLYNNTTKTKNVLVNTSDTIGAGVIGGAISGIIVGMVALVGGKKKKEEPLEQEQAKLYKDITNKVEPSPKVPEKKDDTIDEILGKLKPEDKTKLKTKTAESEVDAVPIKTQQILKASEVRIGNKKYTESQILSKLSSLPRGLPNEFFGKDLTDLSALLMIVEYRTDKNGEIVFQSGTRWYYGDPDNIATFMQRAKHI
jgi:peptidoglycan hydrolase CwlO-like protein